ncbi:MAG: hypothetical protein HON62_10295 [Rhodospirillaceae bacterium]|jgi:hypothetical protein|nr:hypothetical protein [Rhodospirillaceae bacterium]MBT6403422.1 hypothetical protein [Rhodospirillaceae bacterium]
MKSSEFETQTITVLADARGAFAGKAHTLQADGGWETADYRLGAGFTWREEAVQGLDDLAALLRGVEPSEFPIRGLLQNPLHKRSGKVRRTVPRNGDTFFPHINGEKHGTGSTPCQWAMIDLDSVPLPKNYDLSTDGEAATLWAVRKYLPECFHGATFFWELSGNAGVKPGLRVHIWVWLDRPVKGGDLAAWLKLEKAPIDPSVLSNDIQPNYCNPPRFKGGADPIKTRTGIFRGASESVALPEIERINKAAGISASGDTLDAPPGFENKLALLGDGAGLAGFHAPLTSAIMSAAVSAARDGGQLDVEGLKARIRAAIVAAPVAAGRDLSDYLSDGYLDRSIRGAVEKAAAIAAEETAERPAFYPAAVGSLDDAEKKIGQAMEAFRQDALQFQRDREAAVAALAAERAAKPTRGSFPVVKGLSPEQLASLSQHLKRPLVAPVAPRITEPQQTKIYREIDEQERKLKEAEDDEA